MLLVVESFVTSINAFGCRHFFAAENLDGFMGMEKAYVIDGDGHYTGLRDLSIELAQSIPRRRRTGTIV
jgi:hypothetical protein